MSEQLRVIKEQLDAMQTQGRGRKDRGPLKLKMFDGTDDPDDHIRHYEAVGLTEGWTEDLKTGFHRTLKDMALQWYEQRVGTIHTDTWDVVKEAYLLYFRSPTYKQDWSRECVRRKQGPQE